MNKHKNYHRFIRAREGHIANVKYYVQSIRDKLDRLDEMIDSSPEGSDYYWIADNFCGFVSPTIPLIMRELMSVKLAYEENRPNAEDYDI